jgi:hypothetical protein
MEMGAISILKENMSCDDFVEYKGMSVRNE